MTRLTPTQLRRRERIETLIRLASPGLDLLLTVGDRVSRIIEPTDVEYYPPRMTSEAPPPRVDSPEKTEN
jgi:hypothetical protein